MDIIDKSCILLCKSVSDKDQAIDEMINVLYKNGKIDSREQFKKAVLAREKEFCTYVGFKTAIPHAKTNHVLKPTVAFLSTKEEFQYGEQADEKVKMLFLIAIPEDSPKEHLRILSNLAVKLMHEDLRNKLENADSVDEVYDILVSQ